MKKIDGIILDIDGTLWNSVPGLTQAWQEEIERQGYPYKLSVEIMQPLFGQRADTFGDVLFSDLPEEERHRLAWDCARAQNDGIRRNRLAKVYPGVKETLEKLREEYPLFIVTNAALPYAELVMEYADIEACIKDYDGDRGDGCKKADNIRLISKKYGLENPVYVGDTVLDQKSALEAGALFIWASYGLGENVISDLKIDRITELPDLLMKLSEEEADD